MARLPQLRVLSLDLDTDTPPDYAQLAALPALERFSLRFRGTVPAGVSRLARLSALRLTFAGPGQAAPPPTAAALTASLQAALEPLRGLTHLQLAVSTFQAGWALPPALAQLSSLRRFMLAGPDEGDAMRIALPPGPWLASLEWAALPAATVVASRRALAAATRLRRLALNDFFERYAQPADWPAALKWAGRHPPLQCVSLCTYALSEEALCQRLASEQHDPSMLTEALAALRRRRPTLFVEPGRSLLQALREGGAEY